jgi:hypothetical protein
MAGLVPAIPVFAATSASQAWMPGTRRPVRPGGKTQRFTTKGLRVMK